MGVKTSFVHIFGGCLVFSAKYPCSFGVGSNFLFLFLWWFAFQQTSACLLLACSQFSNLVGCFCFSARHPCSLSEWLVTLSSFGVLAFQQNIICEAIFLVGV